MLGYCTHLALDLDTDLAEYIALNDYLWAFILCPGQGGIARDFGEVNRSWKERGGIRTHNVVDWLLHSESEICKLATEACK